MLSAPSSVRVQMVKIVSFISKIDSPLAEWQALVKFLIENLRSDDNLSVAIALDITNRLFEDDRSLRNKIENDDIFIAVMLPNLSQQAKYNSFIEILISLLISQLKFALLKRGVVFGCEFSRHWIKIQQVVESFIKTTKSIPAEGIGFDKCGLDDGIIQALNGMHLYATTTTQVLNHFFICQICSNCSHLFHRQSFILRKIDVREKFAPHCALRTRPGQGNSTALRILCLNKMAGERNKRAIYVANTIDSAIQACDEMNKIAHYTNIRCSNLSVTGKSMISLFRVRPK